MHTQQKLAAAMTLAGIGFLLAGIFHGAPPPVTVTGFIAVTTGASWLWYCHVSS